MDIITKNKINKIDRKRDTAATRSGAEKTYVTLDIGGELYGIDVMKVSTISGLIDIRPVPNAKPYMKGVITIRNTIVPVIDMRIKFNLNETDYTKTTVIAIVTVRDRLIGLLVDAVSDVTSLSISDVQDTPHFSADIDTDCISGISKIGERLVVIMNTDKIVTLEELESMSEQIIA